jgi:hypothetical protein
MIEIKRKEVIKCTIYLSIDFKHLGDQNHREKNCYVASEFITLLVGICKKFDIYYQLISHHQCLFHTALSKLVV